MLAVMVFHYNPAWLPGGFVGVDVFLVISGFLITSILINKKSKLDYTLVATLKYFYVSRFTRIAPAYFVMLILVAVVAAVLFLPSDFATFKDGLEKAAWFTSNHYFAEFGDYFAPANHEQPLLHTWSLAVEMQFYLLAPLLVLLLPVNALKALFVTLLAGLTLLADYRLRTQGIEQATYYSLYARLPAFFAGGLAALSFKPVSASGNRWRTTLGIALIAFAVVLQPELGAFPGSAALIPVAGSVLLLTQPARGLLALLLCSRTLVWIGALSYSLYLWHWPVLAFLRYFSGAEVLEVGLGFVFVLATLSLSMLTYYGVEKLFRGKQTRERKSLRWWILVVAIFGTSQAIGAVNELFTPEQLPIEYRRYANPATICHGKIAGECLKGDLSSDREILVLGDSHAAMLNTFFDHIGKELGFKARIITASSCVTIPGFDYKRLAEWAHEPCIKQINYASRYLENASHIVIAGKWSRHMESREFERSLLAFFKKNQNAELFVLSQIPKFKRNISRVMRFVGLGFEVGVEKDLSSQIANKKLSGICERFRSVEFLSLSVTPILQNAPFYNGVPIYHDEHHLNEIGARLYAESTKSQIRSILVDSL